jgi:hypothetical protein
MLVGFAYFLVILNLPLRFQLVNGETPVKAGIHTLPLLVSAGIGSAIGVAASIKRNFIFQVLLIATIMTAVGCGLLSTLDPSRKSVQRKVYGYQVVLGIGCGLTTSTMTLMTILEAEFEDLAAAQGLIAQVRFLGGTIGIAMSTIVFNKEARRVLLGVLAPAELAALLKSPGVALTFSPKKQHAIRDVFGASFNSYLRNCMYVCLAATVISGFIWQRNPPNVVVVKKRLEDYLEENRMKKGSTNENTNDSKV